MSTYALELDEDLLDLEEVLSEHILDHRVILVWHLKPRHLPHLEIVRHAVSQVVFRVLLPILEHALLLVKQPLDHVRLEGLDELEDLLAPVVDDASFQVPVDEVHPLVYLFEHNVMLPRLEENRKHEHVLWVVQIVGAQVDDGGFFVLHAFLDNYLPVLDQTLPVILDNLQVVVILFFSQLVYVLDVAF